MNGKQMDGWVGGPGVDEVQSMDGVEEMMDEGQQLMDGRMDGRWNEM